MRPLIMLPSSCLIAVLLAGCDFTGLFPAADEPIVVIQAGYKIKAGGQSVPVSGFDECPRQHSADAPAAGDNGHNCIVLSGDRSEVPVRVFLPSGTATESWKIIREAGTGGNGYSKASLQRPDGTFVMAADQ